MPFILNALFLVIFLKISSSYAAHPIVLISIDGLRTDAISKAKASNILAIMAGGTYFEHANTIRPSVTLPAHTSMLTGLDPQQHGIWWDDYQPLRGVIKDKTALEIAHEAGFDTAIFIAKDKLLHLNRPGAVDYFEQTDKAGSFIADAFAKYVEKHGLPDLSFLHVPDPDTQGHLTTWMSKSYLKGVFSADQAVGRIVAIARSKSSTPPTIIITADHGGWGFGHLMDVDDNNHIPWMINGDGISAGVIKSDKINIYDTAATILALLNLAIPKHWRAKPVPGIKYN